MPVDVTEASFEQEVLEKSKEVPVVVDFWAAWCGPCRALTPVLESAEKKRDGKVVLAKVDTEANPGLSRAFGIQGIPAVKAFKDGRVVDEFVGAKPSSAVEAFFDGLVPREAEVLAAQGDEASLRRALDLEPKLASAGIPLARLLLSEDKTDEALKLAERFPGNFAAEGMASRIRLAQDEAVDVSGAFEKLDAGDVQGALDALIETIPSADGAKDELRQAVVGILDELGVEHPLAREYRRKLASALY